MKFLRRISARTVIRIREGSARCMKGRVMEWQMSSISGLAVDANLNTGEIWMDGLGKVDFSDDIPEEFHQRIRNVMASD